MLRSWFVKCVKWRGTHDITPSECLWSSGSGSGSGCCVETVRVSLETWEREEREERTIVRQPPGVSRHHVHNERCPPVQIKNTKFPYQRRASGSGLIPHQTFVTLSCTGHITHYHDILYIKCILFQVWHTSVLNKLDQVVATSYSRNHAEVCNSDIIPWQPDPDLASCVQMTVLQQAHLYVDQLRREANKTRINVSEAIQEMMVNAISYPNLYAFL